MSEPSIRQVGIALFLKVSKYGSGTYMRIPTDIAESLMLKPGDRVELKVEKVYPKEMKMLGKDE